jgi:hypothetical protein
MAMVSLWAMLLPVIGIALGLIRPRRDMFFLLVYAQSVIYVDLAPLFVLDEIPAATQERYRWVQAWALVLFQLPFVAIYAARMRKKAPDQPLARTFVLSSPHLALFCAGIVVLALGYWFVAINNGLIYRRLSEDLAGVQIAMSLPEFAVYRVFIELGQFLLAAMVLVYRLHPTATVRDKAVLQGAIVITFFSYLGYTLINSRLNVLTLFAMLFAVWNLTQVRRVAFRVGGVLAVVVGMGVAVYSVRVVENVRYSFQTGGNLFDPRNLLPMANHVGINQDELRWRLNGVDLMALIADNVETQGPAMGTSWAGPLLVSLDPVVRTPFTLDMKLAGLTTAKSFLLLRYGGIAKTDHYNCMLSDAYGNFSIWGFLLVAIVLGMLLSWATATVATSTAPMFIAAAMFVLIKVLPFEQEFGNLMFGWFKLAPFAVLIIVLFPLRRAASNRRPGGNPASRLEVVTPTPLPL